ncbi:HigA family addiction module antitoxin [Chitinophaga sp.]|uniref:HigA family addiction module antitoxin n=1 Tax=Chitinophaga sp. TaxID=1869181 RepID=UPI0039C86FA4
MAKDINIPQTRVAAILKGTRRITADTALRLSMYFGTSPKFWLGLQDDYFTHRITFSFRFYAVFLFYWDYNPKSAAS